jgi:drug/metabolite transporter (DMT)-like permease
MIFSGILIGIGAYIINKKDINDQILDENSTKSSRNTTYGLLWALFASLSWAVGLAFSDYSISQTNQILGLGILSTLLAMMIRFLFASVILIGISLIEQRKKPIPKSHSTWKFLILSAILSYSLGSIFFGEAVYIVGASFMALISTAMPLFTIPFSYLINKEKLSRKGFIGVIMTIIGVILIII